MTLLLGVIVLAVVAGLAAGGSIHRFAELRLRWWLLAPIGFALQAVPLPEGRHGGDLLIRMLVFGASYVLVLAFAIRNRRIVGVPLIVAGLTLNGLVVTANGGMPVSRSAVVASGQGAKIDVLLEEHDPKHHLSDSSDVLTPLGDVIGVPQPLGEVISVGDVFVYAGLAWLIVAVMRGRTVALARLQEPEPYQGRHRRRSRRKAPAEAAAPAAATMWGNER